MRNFFDKTKKGFTLIELLVVIALISILTSIVIANLNSARAKSRDTKRISDVSNLQLALALYLNKYGVYPVATSDGMTVLNTTLASSANKFINSIPTDPINNTLGGKVYKYGYYSLNGSTYCMGATLETNVSAVDMTETCTTDITSNTYKVKK